MDDIRDIGENNLSDLYKSDKSESDKSDVYNNSNSFKEKSDYNSDINKKNSIITFISDDSTEKSENSGDKSSNIHKNNDIYINKCRLNNLALYPNKIKKNIQFKNNNSPTSHRNSIDNYKQSNRQYCYNTIPPKEDIDNYSYSPEYSVGSLDRKLQKINDQNGNNILFKKKNNVKFKQNNNIYSSNELYDIENVSFINPSKLINTHLNEIQLRIIGHSYSAIMYDRREKFIGYPVTILSSFLTSTLMINIGGDNYDIKIIVEYITLTLSIISFLLSVSRQYFDFAKRYQSHDLSSKLYTTLLRSVEVRLIKNNINKEEKRDIFKDIIDQMSIIEQYETPIPYSIDKKIRDNHSELIDISIRTE